MKRTIILLSTFLLLFFSNLQSFGQIKSISNMLSGSTQDASKLFQAYLKPYANAFGADLNGGWYNTAKVHKLGGFDLTLSVSAAFVPSTDKTFDPSKLGLTGTVASGVTSAPTVAGENKPGPEISYKTGNVTVAKFNTPKGTGFGIIPAPMLQLGIGLIKGTDVTVRYLPSFNVGDYGSINMWGVGVKHSLKQWIPVIKMTPFFNLSVFGGYTQLHTSVNLSLQPEIYVDKLGATDQTTLAYDNQKMALTAKNFTGNIIASFDFPVIALYGGIGFSNTKTNLKLTGDYPMTSLDNGKLVVNDVNRLTDPINMEMKSTDGSKTKPRLNAGVRFKFAIITLHFDYTYANYSVATAGLGLSFR
jgi:hypothetical protein